MCHEMGTDGNERREKGMKQKDLLDSDEHTIIRANPGWHVACQVWGDGAEGIIDVDWTEVIAWRVMTWAHESVRRQAPNSIFVHSMVTPITSAGCMDDWIIRDPQGKISSPSDRDFTDDAALLAYYREEEAAKRAAKRAAKPVPVPATGRH